MADLLASSELVLNPDSSVYHCNLHAENLADVVFLVGDPDRVPVVSSYFDSIEFKTQKREIVTHTGTVKGRRISVVSTGMGTDNIDIVLSELDAVTNIDLKNKTFKPEHKQLTFIRMGTSGALQREIPVDSFVVGEYGLGLDGLIYYYKNGKELNDEGFVGEFMKHTDWLPELPKPYLVKADENMVAIAKGLGIFAGVTTTATGFFGPQGRVLRLGISQKHLNERLSDFRYNDLKITNFEMETSAIYGLSRLMGHRALTVNVIVANRFSGEFSKDSHASINRLIEKMLFEFLPKI